MYTSFPYVVERAAGEAGKAPRTPIFLNPKVASSFPIMSSFLAKKRILFVAEKRILFLAKRRILFLAKKRILVFAKNPTAAWGGLPPPDEKSELLLPRHG